MRVCVCASCCLGVVCVQAVALVLNLKAVALMSCVFNVLAKRERETSWFVWIETKLMQAIYKLAFLTFCPLDCFLNFSEHLEIVLISPRSLPTYSFCSALALI